MYRYYISRESFSQFNLTRSHMMNILDVNTTIFSAYTNAYPTSISTLTRLRNKGW